MRDEEDKIFAEISSINKELDAASTKMDEAAQITNKLWEEKEAARKRFNEHAAEYNYNK